MTIELNIKKSEISTKKIRLMRGVVVKAEQETPDTWTLHLNVSEQDKNYLAGQFISIAPHQFPEILDMVRFFEYTKGKKEPVRAYSLTSAPHEKYVSITIKPEAYEPYPGSFPPLLSPILASNILLGRELEFTGYAGAYIMPHDLASHIDHVMHLVAGSGIVPSYSIIKDELIKQKYPHIKHTLIDVNKSVKDIIFHNDLINLQKRYPEQFTIKHFITQEHINNRDGEHYHHGRPSFEQVQQLVKHPQNTLFFACGPAITKWQKKHAEESGIAPKPRFMEWVHDVIDRLKVDKKHFKREIYG
ncbi:MAG TPA: oxidoreductase [Myxococcota bacterium]|nr:oxidoreductase [Myxococcota bacterium]